MSFSTQKGFLAFKTIKVTRLNDVNTEFDEYTNTTNNWFQCEWIEDCKITHEQPPPPNQDRAVTLVARRTWALPWFHG